VIDEGLCPDAEYLATATRAGALNGRLAILHRDFLGILDLDLLLVLDAITLGHVEPPNTRCQKGPRRPKTLRSLRP